MRTTNVLLALAVLCHALVAADAVLHHYARLLPFNALSANVTGDVGIYTSPGANSTGNNDTVYVVLKAWGLDAQCKLNTCAGHVHANSSGGCASPGAHLLNVDGVTDPWLSSLQYSTTHRDGSMVFTVEIAAGNAAVAGYPFIVHSGGVKVACGIVNSGVAYTGTAGAYRRSQGPRNFEARLAPLAPVTAPLAPFTVVGTVSVWASTSRSLSVTIAASSALAEVCKNNTCQAHVHDGSDCDGVTDRWNGTTMEYVGPATNDPGLSVFVVAITDGNAELAGQPFVVHDANRSVSSGVACGVLAPAESLVRKYEATLAPIVAPPEWQVVDGSVAVFSSDVGMYIIIDVLSAELDGACRGGACGAHVHAGYDCGANIQGHLLDGDGQTDAWSGASGKMQWVGRRTSGVSIFALYIPFGNTAIVGKPFIVHSDAGTKVACGMLGVAVFNSDAGSCCPDSGIACCPWAGLNRTRGPFNLETALVFFGDRYVTNVTNMSAAGTLAPVPAPRSNSSGNSSGANATADPNATATPSTPEASTSDDDNATATAITALLIILAIIGAAALLAAVAAVSLTLNIVMRRRDIARRHEYQPGGAKERVSGLGPAKSKRPGKVADPWGRIAPSSSEEGGVELAPQRKLPPMSERRRSILGTQIAAQPALTHTRSFETRNPITSVHLQSAMAPKPPAEVCHL